MAHAVIAEATAKATAARREEAAARRAERLRAREPKEAPRPTDERVVLRQVGERKYGVVRFSGLTGDKVVKEKAEWLKAALEKDGFTVKGPFVLARYNPPFTLPPLRTNEVMVPVE